MQHQQQGGQEGDLLQFRTTVRNRNRRRQVPSRKSALIESPVGEISELSDGSSRSPSPHSRQTQSSSSSTAAIADRHQKQASTSSMANDVTSTVHDYKEKIKSDAEALVLKQFPKKVMELDALVQSELFSKVDLRGVNTDLNIPIPGLASVAATITNNHEMENALAKKRKFEAAIESDIPSGAKVFVLPNGTVPCNKHIVELIDIAKPHMRQLVEDASALKMWIQFLIPRIEDGNNFGVSIQEDILGEIRNVESDAAVYFDQISRYFMTRAKIVSKVAKYPHVDDYRRTVQELDEKEYLSMRLVLIDLRNHYSTVHDLITKNLEKIKKPRTSNSDTMY